MIQLKFKNTLAEYKSVLAEKKGWLTEKVNAKILKIFL